MFFRKKQETRTYDKENQKPVLRISICTGEKVAGFQDRHTGNITEVMLVRTGADLETFRRLYNIAQDEISTVY